MTPPAVTGADLTGTSLSIHFDEPVDPTSVPDPSAFAVSMPLGATVQHPTVNSVAISGSTVTLLLGTFSGTSGSVTYTPPSGSKIQDLVANTTGAFTEPFDPDTTPPVPTGATVDGTALEIDLDEPLAASTPDPSAFTVTAGTTTIPVSSVTISGSDVELTLASAVVSGQTVSVTYTQPGSNAIQDAAGNATVTFTETVVNNTTPAPQPTGGTVDGSTVTVAFSSPLASPPVPDPSAFSVSADGSTISVSSVVDLRHDAHAHALDAGRRTARRSPSPTPSRARTSSRTGRDARPRRFVQGLTNTRPPPRRLSPSSRPRRMTARPRPPSGRTSR